MPSSPRIALLALPLLALAAGAGGTGCGAPTITQSLLTGSPCKASVECGTQPDYICLTDRTLGYCTRACGSDADCPPEGICLIVDGALGSCRVRCDNASTCRIVSGYACKAAVNSPTLVASHAYCDSMAGAVLPDMAATSVDMAAPVDQAHGG